MHALAGCRTQQPGRRRSQLARVAARAARRAGAAGVFVGAIGCASLPVPLPGGHEFSRRVVAAKEAENTLVADDGGSCRVKADTFEKVVVGETHRCVWRDRSSNSGTVTDPPGPSAPGVPQPQGASSPRRRP